MANTERNFAAEIADRGKAITSSLNSGNPSGALKTALTNPPYGCKDEKLRTENNTNVASILKSIGKKEADVDKAVDSLSSDELDVLMKYIYAGLGREDADKSLLYWHASALRKAGGLGPVVRVLADKVNVL